LIPGPFIVSGILYSAEKHVKDFITKYIDEVRRAYLPRGFTHRNHVLVVCHDLQPLITI